METGASFAPALPAPQVLAAAHRPSAAVLYLNGAAYDAAVAQHVSAAGDNAALAPQDAQAGPLVEAMAYALYRFNTGGKVGAQTLSLYWSGAPPSLEDCWIGFANWGRGRWDWFAPAAAGALALDAQQFARYSREGSCELLCVLAVTGSQACTLKALGFEPPLDAWSMFGHDPRHTFCSSAVGPQAGTLKWTYRTAGCGLNVNMPAVAADGTSYTCDQYYVNAVSADGDILWRYLPSKRPRYGPTLGPDGTVLIATWSSTPYAVQNSSVIALNPDGSLKWQYDDNEHDAQHAPVVGADGAVYICPRTWTTGQTVALNPDGSLRWSAPYGGSEAPAVAGDGKVYISDSAGLHALDAEGAWRWTNTDLSYFETAVGPDGTVYCYNGMVEETNYIYAVSAAGVIAWTYSYPGSTCLPGRPEFGAGGVVYVPFWRNYYTGTDAALCALDSSGGLLWSYATEYGFFNVAVGFDGKIYAVTHAVEPEDTPSIICFIGAGAAEWTYGAFAVPVSKDNLNGLAPRPGGGVIASEYCPGALLALDSGGSLQWRTGFGGTVMCNPTVNGDGRVYFGCSDGRMYCLDPAGQLEWYAEYPGLGLLSPLLAGGAVYGSVFRRPNTGPLAAWSLDGALLWEYGPPQDGDASSPVLLSDGGVCYGCGTDYTALDTNGGVLWSATSSTEHYSPTCPAVAPDGSVYACSSDYYAAGALYAFNAAGILQWSYAPEHVSGYLYSPCVGPAGEIYVCTGYQLHALNPDGTVIWTYAGQHQVIEFEPALAADGTLYVNCGEGYLNAINPDGTSKWEFATAGSFCSTPAVDGEGKVYFGGSDGYFYCVDANGQLVWKQKLDTGPGYPPAIAPDGTVYTGAGNMLYAFGD